MDGGTRARVEEEKALDSSRLRSSARLGFASSSSAGSSRVARRKRKKRRRQQRRSSNINDEVLLISAAVGGVGSVKETLDGALVIKTEQQHQQQQQLQVLQLPGAVTLSNKEKKQTNSLNTTKESTRKITKVGSGIPVAASLSSDNTFVNRRAVNKRSSRRCIASTRRNAMTMDLQRLITEVHARPAIWDQKNVNYHNRDVILKMWREIARACEVSTDVAKSKWKHLRDNFRNELKKTYRGKCDGGTNEHDSKWVWFKSLFFLRDQMNSRVIGCTLPQNCTAAHRSSPDGMQIEPQIDILEGHEETRFDELDGDSCQSMLSNDDGLQQVMPPPKMSKIGRKRALLDAIDKDYSESDRKRFEALQKRLSVSQEDEDDTYHFLMSVRNPLKSLPLDRQMFVRLKIQELVYNEINTQNQQNQAYNLTQDVKPPKSGFTNRTGVGDCIGSDSNNGNTVGYVSGRVVNESLKIGNENGNGSGSSEIGSTRGQSVNETNNPTPLLHNCTIDGSADDTLFS